MAKPKVDALYPLSPMQRAFLFHRLHRTASDQGFLQVRCVLDGALDVEAFTRAWREVAARHVALRTAIHWENLDRPLQVVFPEVDTPLHTEDWRGLSPDEQTRRFEAFLAEDRDRGLSFTEAPVARLALFRVDDTRHRLVWTCHHILLDGWSAALVLREVHTVYTALRAGRPPALPAPVSFGRYLQWVDAQDESAGESYWRTRLAGFGEPTPLPLAAGSRLNDDGMARRSFALPADATARLQAFAHTHRLTPGIIVQGLWALLLGRATDLDDIVFGTTVSGRAGALPGIERMAGLFMNVVPVRMRIALDAAPADWLSEGQDEQRRAQAFEHIPLGRIQGWSAVPGTRRLFDTLVVFENYPSRRTDAPDEALTLHSFSSDLTTTYPLTLAVRPGASLALDFVYDASRFQASDIDRLGAALVAALDRLPHPDTRRLGDLILAFAAPRPAEAPRHSADPVGRSAPPRNRNELELVRLWEDVFGFRPIAVHDDFFELGGHSLLAIRLFDRIRETFGRSLPLATLFERPTVARLAELLDEEAPAPPWSALVPIQPSGDRPPLFCFHAGGGEVLFYHPLARRLGPDQPVYGLQAPGLDGKTDPLRRVEAMAERYLPEIRAVQPSGPYAFVGRCFGNLVALEVAQRLRAEGEAVALLAMIDSAPELAEESTDAVAEPSRRYVHRLLAEEGVWPAVQTTIAARSRRVKNRLQRAWIDRYGDERSRHLARIREAIAEADRAYRPRPYPGRITLLRSTEYESRPDKAYHLDTWRRIARDELDIDVIQAPHDHMFDEAYVDRLADRLADRLGAAWTEDDVA